MDNIKNIVGGGIIAIAVGGAALTFTQEDLVDNFANETGLTQEQAEEYVGEITEDDYVPFSQIGVEYLGESVISRDMASEIDCDLYEYEWETQTLSCPGALVQLIKLADAEYALGNAYIELESEDSGLEHIRHAAEKLDEIYSIYQLEVLNIFYEPEVIEELKLTNRFNKALFVSAIEANQETQE